jgi:hypothetical protein
MGSHEELVSGKFLVTVPGLKARVNNFFITNTLVATGCQHKNINEEISHV